MAIKFFNQIDLKIEDIKLEDLDINLELKQENFE